MGRLLETTGRSSRTPVKHYLLSAMLGKVCGVLALDSPRVPCRITSQQPLLCVDLCGGDGLQTEEHESSPLIMHYHCDQLRKRGKSASLQVFEKHSNTYESLVSNCGWMPKDWVTLTNADSRNYLLPQLKETQAAFVHCDPNSIHQIPLTNQFVAGFNRYTTYLVTLGCNVGGQKILPLESRKVWFDYVEMLTRVLPRHHDAILFWLVRDQSQWAYLLSLPAVWSQSFQELAIKNTSKIWRKGVEGASYRSERVKFEMQLRNLFLTKEENGQ